MDARIDASRSGRVLSARLRYTVASQRTCSCIDVTPRLPAGSGPSTVITPADCSLSLILVTILEAISRVRLTS